VFVLAVLASAAPDTRKTLRWNLELPARPTRTGRVLLAPGAVVYESGRENDAAAGALAYVRDPSTLIYSGPHALDHELCGVTSVGANSGAEVAVVAAPALDSAVVTHLMRENWSGVRTSLAASEAALVNPVARLLLGHACLALNRNDESFLLFYYSSPAPDLEAWTDWTTGLARKHPGSPVARYLSADAAARRGRFKAALAALENVPESGSPRLRAMMLNARGVTHCGVRDFDAAMLDFFDGRQCATDFADIHASAGARALLLSDGASSAHRSYRRALSASPRFALAAIGKGAVELVLGRHGEGVATLNAIRCGPELTRVVEQHFERHEAAKAHWLEAHPELIASLAPGMTLKKVKLLGAQFGERAKRFGLISTDIGVGITESVGQTIKVSVGPKGRTVSIDPSYVTRDLSKTMRPVIQQSLANSYSRSHQINLELHKHKSSGAGGVDAKPPTNLYDGCRWGFLTYFGLVYPVSFGEQGQAGKKESR
jgi:hypothetical protein